MSAPCWKPIGPTIIVSLSGGRAIFIEKMHHLSIAARKQMEGVLTAEGWEKHGGHWRQWPLVTRLPAFTEPWREYTLEDVRKQFPQAAHPLVEYFDHFARMYDGHVVLVSGAWEKIGEGTPAVGGDPLLRDARLWRPQFARTRAQRETLRGLRKNQQGEVDESVDLRKQVGDTTILRWPEGSDGPWCLRGGALTLPMLWQQFGSLFTAQELLFYYQNCPKVAKTRAHAWGSREVRAAARLRKETYGHWGHRNP